MPIPLIVKEVVGLVGKQALIGGLSALGVFILHQGVPRLESQGVKLPVVLKKKKEVLLKVKK